MKKISECPTISDQILFELETPDERGLLVSDPDSITKITISYIEKDCGAKNDKLYKAKSYNKDLQEKYKKALEKANINPTETNIFATTEARKYLNASVVTSDYYFQEQIPVFVAEKVWNKEDSSNSILKQVVYNKKNQEQHGRFTFTWQPPQKEGNYVVAWEYKINGQQFSSHEMFLVGSAPPKDILHSTTVEGKYEMLLKRYTPQMYKYKIRKDDLTPEVVSKLDKIVAKGFTYLEDMANQLIDVYDANRTPHALLPVLANMLNLNLHGDERFWRRQIKEAVPLFKMKGTLIGLEMALDQAGIKLNKVTRLWQIKSQYYRVDEFEIKESGIIGDLTYLPLDKMEIGIKSNQEYLPVPDTCCQLAGKTLIWVDNHIKTFIGDKVKVRYKIQEVPESRVGLENYLESLPLAHKGNWNVHLLEGDDPFFDVLIPTRHPFAEPVVFGKTRTSFMYSENVYNMDTYDGSLRPSTDPRHLDRDWRDECGYCLSSQFNVDVEGEDTECVAEIIRENMPFHAVLRQINVTGVINDFIPVIESIESSAVSKDGDKVEINEEITWE